MDFYPIINQVVGVSWYLIPLGILAAILKSAWFKGVIGEFVVNLSAKLRKGSGLHYCVNGVARK